MADPAPGARLSLHNYRGTVKFVGHVERTKGIWLGVDWDNPQRGKHNGEKDGVKYFDCLCVHESTDFVICVLKPGALL